MYTGYVTPVGPGRVKINWSFIDTCYENIEAEICEMLRIKPEAEILKII